MILFLHVLEEDSTLNNFSNIEEVNFMSGSDVVVRMRLMQQDRNIRYIPDSGATITVDFKKSDETILAKTASHPFADDRSIIEVSLTNLETVDVISQDLIVKIDEAGSITFAKKQNGLRRVLVNQGCA